MSRDMLLIPLGGSGGSEPGAQGIQGSTGAQGIMGYQGMQGLQGYWGAQGAAGQSGLQGLQGLLGYQGTSGQNGLQGLQGYFGYQGTSGSNGLQGLQGYRGFQGPAGSGGSTRLDISQLNGEDLYELYTSYQTLMASNDLYWGVYPITSVRQYTHTYGGSPITGLLFEYNLWAGLQSTVKEGTVSVGAQFLVEVAAGTCQWFDLSMQVYFPLSPAMEDYQEKLTAGEGISIQGTTISATGGGAKQWFGTQAQFEALQSVDMDTDYYISDRIDWSEIGNTPAIPTKISELPNDEGYVTDKEMKNYINERKIMHIVNSHNWYGTQAEYESLQTLNPDTNYHIEGDEVSLQMTFTFTDSTQAVYDIYIKPTV